MAAPTLSLARPLCYDYRHHMGPTEEPVPSREHVFEFAHELNNALTVISGYAAMLGLRLSANPAAGAPSLMHAVDEIRIAADHAAELNRQLVSDAQSRAVANTSRRRAS